MSDDHGVIDAGQIEHSEEGGTDPAFAVGASAVLNKPNPQVCLDCHGWIDHPNTHPYMPNYYDRVKNAPLTCTSTCHNPHGTTLNFMLRNFSYPFDGSCLQCHTDVGITF